ncbi:MAG: hypothetical protein H6719_30730 [Sandaracinaceae bacterium]|nr:hypothetical protein [Sandaracinaceae bacterium]
MRALTQSALLGAMCLLLVTSCGGEEPPPEGFHLELRLVSVAPSVLDSVQIRFEPQGTDEMFMLVEPMSYESGAISIAADADGTLLMTISGSHITQFATDDGMGGFLYDLELWSNDMRARNPAPSVRVVGLRGGEQIAEGFLFLPQWPLPLGQRSRVTVQCRMAVADRCVP